MLLAQLPADRGVQIPSPGGLLPDEVVLAKEMR